MDSIDVKLIEILSENARATASEIAPAVNLSVPAINKRISRLRKNGTIRAFTAVIDGEKAGKPITTFILVTLQQASAADKLLEYAHMDPDVLECYAVTGEYDYILKVCASDVKSLEKKLKQLKQQRGVVKSHTLFCLLENKFQTSVLPDESAIKKESE